MQLFTTAVGKNAQEKIVREKTGKQAKNRRGKSQCKVYHFPRAVLGEREKSQARQSRAGSYRIMRMANDTHRAAKESNPPPSGGGGSLTRSGKSWAYI